MTTGGDRHMDFLSKLEQTILRWLKNAPHLPDSARKWCAENAWWVVAICAVAAGVGALGLVVALFNNMSALGSPFAAYYASETLVAWATIKIAVKLGFTLVVCLLLALAIMPVRTKHKKGWVLFFCAWGLSALGVVVSAVLTLSTLNFLTDLIFGALWLGVWAYFLFEIHGQFIRVERTKGVKKEK